MAQILSSKHRDTDTGKKWITITELMRLSGWARSTIFNYIRAGKLEGVKDLSGFWLIDYYKIPEEVRSRFKEENGK
jgi:predicted site-specific integrase-resolvase